MRVYKFRCRKFGLKALSEERIKIAEFSNLNDPFDLRPFKMTDESHSRVLGTIVSG